MIVSKAPVRISLGGGGTDLESYYSKYGGFLIAAAINKYVFIAINRRFYHSLRLSYSKTEIVDEVEQIKHNIFREALSLLNIKKGIEIVSIADVPSNCGLGTSSSFTVALLNGLHSYTRSYLTLSALAEEACKLEINVLKQPVGKQDQYAAAYGGVNVYRFGTDGKAEVEPLEIAYEKLQVLENNILLFFIGGNRKTADILVEQDANSKRNDVKTIENLHRIKKIGLMTKKIFEKGDLDLFGELLHEHWCIKKSLSANITDGRIDEIYELGRKNGALGGKIIGAGGGGFLMLYCPGDKGRLIRAMETVNLKPMWYRFEFEGARVVFNQ